MKQFFVPALLFLLSCEMIAVGEEPRLIIDPQGHSGMVGDMVFTPDGSRLISVGDDKTIRIWAVNTGGLLKTLRTFRGDAEDGKHFACALSPDARWLAVGGWASSEDENYGTITVIDLSNETVAMLLRGHTDVVHSLSFSPDGAALLSASSDNTARVWGTGSWQVNPAGNPAPSTEEATVLEGHVNKVYAARFISGSDRIITVSFDHSVRFWKNGSSGYTETALYGEHAAPVAALEVSPNGSFAVTGDLEGKALLWNLETSSLIKTLDAELAETVGAISISPDSGKVMVSSETSTGGTTKIYSLPAGEELKELDFHDNSVTAAAWHPDKPLVMLAGSNNHIIVAFNPDSGEVDKVLTGVGSSVWNVALRESDLDELALGFIMPSPQNGVQAMFDLNALLVRGINDTDDLSQFHNAIGIANGIELNFESLTDLRVGNEGTISIDPGSNNRMNVATLVEGGESVVIGSSYFLTRYKKEGNTFEEVTQYRGHEGGVRMVCATLDGNYLVSGSLDQTVRLWNLKTGDLLATLFVAMDGEWVLWTPAGYFAASPKGGTYIGWQFNRGMEQMAEFISGDQLYDEFYRPDIVRKTIEENRPVSEVLVDLEVEEFGLDAALAGTPGVAILEPVSSGTATNRRQPVLVRATDEGGGIGEIRLFHEGKRLHPDGPGAFRGGALEVPFTVSLMAGQNQIVAIAVNPDGVESPPVTVDLEFGGTVASAKLYVLGVGVNEYQNPRFNLNYCRPDVEAFVAAMEQGGEKLFREIEVTKLYDAEATAENIVGTMLRISKEATADDVFVFAFAGHGVMSGDGAPGGEFYVVPHNVTQMYGNDDLLAEKALSGEQLQSLAAQIPARKQLMVLDACQSGGVIESFAVRGAAEERALAQLARASGIYVLASTRSEQFATEAAELGHGLFTYAFLEALNGQGDGNEDKKITVKEVEIWLNERVPELSEKFSGSAQYPNSFARGQDFPIGLIE
ncbi:MAG: caspase family protein [Verrucomicrobiota bacterium]